MIGIIGSNFFYGFVKFEAFNLFLRSKTLIKIIQLNMSILVPPSTVQGMTILEKNAFTKTIQVPWIKVEVSKMGVIKKYFRNYLLKLENFKPVQSIEETIPECKKIILNPDVIKDFNSFKEIDRAGLEQLGYTNEDIKTTEIDVGYDQWRGDEILKAVLPSDKDSLTSYSRIGQIVHVNLHEHLIPFKQLIGQVLLEKVKGAKTIVNKTDAIDNTYRNFQMEVLCGESNLKASVKENRCIFELDFGLVYWNPRLCTEHERIVNLIEKGDVLYDVFAGIGPFAIPAAKKGATVLANDLNPESYKWLTHNTKLNKLKSLATFNKDGREFIITELKRDLIQCWESKFSKSIHITMNLPAMATTFLNAFDNLLPSSLSELNGPLPKVHVYCFVKDSESEKCAVDLVESDFGHKLGDQLIEVKLVRKVSPSKVMMRVSFTLPRHVLVQLDSDISEPPSKKLCTEGSLHHGQEQEQGQARTKGEGSTGGKQKEASPSQASVQGRGSSQPQGQEQDTENQP